MRHRDHVGDAVVRVREVQLEMVEVVLNLGVDRGSS
jgi:hypothetical protein